MLALLTIAAALAAPVTFEVNDALVKDRRLDGVEVRIAADPGAVAGTVGSTDEQGRFVADLAPGTWYVSYRKPGWVPIGTSPIEVPEAGTVITTTLSPLLEAQGLSGHRRIQVVLNWGSDWSDVPDCDAHLVCAVDGFEVYYGDKEHAGVEHTIDLDVDDTDWGGPETVTLLDPPPGRYQYFVRNFSGGSWELGESDVVVRVLFDDAVVGEYRVPEDVIAQDWRPFAAIEVSEDLRPKVVPYTPEQLAAGEDRRAGVGCGCIGIVGGVCGTLVGTGLLFLVVGVIRRRT